MTNWEIFVLRKLKNGSHFPNHDILIPTVHLCQKYIIKRYCLMELQNCISCIIYMFIIFFRFVYFCVFYVLFWETSFFTACVHNLFSVFHEFLFNIIKTFMYVVYICAIWPLVILFSLYKNYFLFIKIQFLHMLVKTCFQRGFERTKNHL